VAQKIKTEKKRPKIAAIFFIQVFIDTKSIIICQLSMGTLLYGVAVVVVSVGDVDVVGFVVVVVFVDDRVLWLC